MSNPRFLLYGVTEYVMQPEDDKPREYAIVFHDSMDAVGTHYESVLSAWFTKGPDESERNDPGAYITATLLQPC